MLIELKCHSCGAILHRTANKDSFICPYCGSVFVWDQQIMYQVGATSPSAPGDFEIQAGVLIRYHGTSTSPIVPESVIVIGERAFAQMPIHSIVLPKGLKEIRAYAFLDCKELEKIDFPDSLERIGTRAFFRCFALRKISWSINGPPKMRYDDGFPFLGTPVMNTTR